MEWLWFHPYRQGVVHEAVAVLYVWLCFFPEQHREGSRDNLASAHSVALVLATRWYDILLSLWVWSLSFVT